LNLHGDAYLISIGIDVGSEYCKIICLNEEKNIIFKDVRKVGGVPEMITKDLLDSAIKAIKKERISNNREYNINITGRNGEIVKDKRINSYILEYRSLAEAATFFDPSIKTIIDTGGFINKVIKLNQGRIVDYSVNDVCSSGAGIFLTLVCKSLDISFEELSKYALESETRIPITSQCSIFAESEVIYLMNEGKNISEIAAGVCESIVGRLVPQIQKINPQEKIIFTGGVSKIKAIRKYLESKLSFTFVDASEDIDPQFFTAFGTAILGFKRDGGGKN
jgi:predicted CoA-substrate-specific enzyme activase